MTDELHALTAEMHRIRQKQDRLKGDETVLWDRFFQIADDLVGEAATYAYVDDELGYKLAREMHNIAPKVDPSKLEESLTHDQWIAITRQERVLDMEKLEQNLAAGLVDKVVVEEATEFPPPSPHKIFKRVK